MAITVLQDVDLEGCAPLQFATSANLDSISIRSPTTSASNIIYLDFAIASQGSLLSPAVLLLVSLFVVHYRRTGIEDAAGSSTTLSSVVRDAIKAVQLSTRFGTYGKVAKEGKSNFPFHVVVSTQKSADLHGQMEWQLVENNCSVAFDGSCFTASDVKTIVENVLDVISCISKGPELALGDIAFSNVSQQHQRAQISTQLPPAPSHTFITLSEAFQDTVAKHSGNISIVDEDRAFTYSELDALSSALANKIAQALHGKKDSGLISWCIPPSPLAIIVIFAILKYGSAHVPLDIRLPGARLNSLISDSGACMLITTSESPDLTLDNPDDVVRLDVSDFIADQSTTGVNVIQHLCRPSPNPLAYVMYTSGSTGKPKGVCINQESVLALVYDRGRFQLGPGDRVAQINNLAWDGSVFDVWATLLTGATLVSFNRYDVLEPTVLAEKFQHHNVTCTFITTSLFRQILNIAPDLFRPLRTLLVGGESIDHDQYRKLYDVNPSVDLFNMYGPTETCCYTTSYIVPKENLPRRGVVPIGRGLDHTQCLIIDRKGRLVPPGVIGQLIIGGRGVGVGYLARPKETAESFLKMELKELGQPPSMFYCSVRESFRLHVTKLKIIQGDLVKWLPNGELQFEGRAQSGQVKIRGQRLELTEVEAACVRTGLVTHAAVAYVKPTDGREPYLTSYFVRKPLPDSNSLPSILDILRALKSTVPAYMIPRHIHFVETLPLTNSGKLDRRVLQEIALKADKNGEDRPNHEGTYVAPESELERRICGIFSDVLSSSGNISVTSSFFDIGGHSLLAMRLKWKIQQELHDHVSLQDVFSGPTPRELAARVEQLRATSLATHVDLKSFPRVADGEYRPLTLGETRFWFAAKVDGPDDPTFFCPHWLRLEGSIDEEILERSIAEIVRRHEIFRTIFLEVDGVPKGKIVDFFAGLERVDLDPNLDEESKSLLRKYASRPFKFGADVMFRSTLFRMGNKGSIVLFALHHMITDGYSRDIMFRELQIIYNAFIRGENHSLSPLPVQYAAFAQWHNTKEYDKMLEPQSKYWVENLQGCKSADFPIDFPRPPPEKASRDGGLQTIFCDSQLVSRLEALCKKENVTMFILFMTVLRLVHYSMTGVEDATLASSAANRSSPEAELLCGYFVNNLTYRIRMKSHDTVSDLLKQVRDLMIGGLANQDVPFWTHVASKLKRDPSTPVFRTVMGYHHFAMTSFELAGGVVGKAWDVDMKATRFDLMVFLNRCGNEIVGDFHYHKDLFKAETVKNIVEKYRYILEKIAGDGSGSLEVKSVLSH
uniref:Carrier domain-containing protein n=1 Tax=Moniliophthora roreri TaxID=221103 RepID=A0A0W0FVH0_MONRR